MGMRVGCLMFFDLDDLTEDGRGSAGFADAVRRGQLLGDPLVEAGKAKGSLWSTSRAAGGWWGFKVGVI